MVVQAHLTALCLPPVPPRCRPAAAGLGRAPATALAYMWWFKGWHLEDAYEHLTGERGVAALGT